MLYQPKKYFVHFNLKIPFTNYTANQFCDMKIAEVCKWGDQPKIPAVIGYLAKSPPPPQSPSEDRRNILGFFTTLRGVYNYVGPPSLRPIE